MRANLGDTDIPGWQVLNKEKLKFEKGDPVRLVATFKPDELMYPILRTYSPLDDFDIEATITFRQGDFTHLHAGIEFRFGDGGDYVASISPQGTFRIGWHNKTDWGGVLSEWKTHPALSKGWGSPNNIRVIAKNRLIKMYLNGVFAAELEDEKFTSGLIRLVLAPKKKKSVVSFQEIILRETR
jgi:hypothetical protein